MSAWLWFLLVALVILPIALRFLADDHPRSDDPPDTGSDEPASVLLAV